MNVQTQVKKGVNVAPSSTSGHYIYKAKKVVNLDEATEIFFVEGESELRTKNHTTLERNESCLITTQVVFDPLRKAYEQVRD